MAKNLAAKAKALAVILNEEFGVPFLFYDTHSGQGVSSSLSRDGRALPPEPGPEAVLSLAAEGRSAVTALRDGRYQLTLVLFESSEPLLLAVGALPRLAGGPEQAREQQRLQRWLQAVSDRLRLGEQLLAHRRLEEEQAAQVKRAWEALLGVADTIQHLRIHKDSERGRQSILKTAQGFLGAQAVFWVPAHAGDQVLVQGEPGLAPADCRQLAKLLARSPDAQPGKPVLWNQEVSERWTGRFPRIANLLAFPLTDKQQAGWLIALNKRDAKAPPGDVGPAGAPFRRADAAVLMPFAALFELQVRGSRRYQELRELLVGLTRSLTAALDAKDSYTYGHSERVSRIALELGRELGLQEDELSDLYLAGLLHDIGKIGIPDTVLCKTGALTGEEFEQIKQHVSIGYNILSDLRPLRNLLPGVLYHHERWDGKGYPEGLAGEGIPLVARILAVADAFDAMNTKRPYRDAIPFMKVEETLEKGAGSQWDRRVIEAFMRCRSRVHLICQRGVGESLTQAIDGALRTGDSSLMRQMTQLPELSRHVPLAAAPVKVTG
jgi:HD-GYP domain-containing protein (c-di-GMP phosphodiesterase class II)